MSRAMTAMMTTTNTASMQATSMHTTMVHAAKARFVHAAKTGSMHTTAKTANSAAHDTAVTMQPFHLCASDFIKHFILSLALQTFLLI